MCHNIPPFGNLLRRNSCYVQLLLRGITRIECLEVDMFHSFLHDPACLIYLYSITISLYRRCYCAIEKRSAQQARVLKDIIPIPPPSKVEEVGYTLQVRMVG